MTDVFDDFNPSGFLPYARLTEASKAGNDLGYTYAVLSPSDDPLSGDAFYAKYGRGRFCKTLRQARARIEADKRACKAQTDASGLINWGKSPAREYAIYKLEATRVE